MKYLEITWCANNCYHANKLWSKQNTLMHPAENKLSRLKAKFKQKDTIYISAYLKGSVRKCEVMRTPEHKRSVKNGVNSNGVKTGSEMRDHA